MLTMQLPRPHTGVTPGGGLIIPHLTYCLRPASIRHGMLIAASDGAPSLHTGRTLPQQKASISFELPMIITLEEFADRMQVGETTVWKWIRSGRLQPGRHYIQIDRIIRFHWSNELIHRLLEDCTHKEAAVAEIAEELVPAADKAHRRKRGETPMDIDYGMMT